MILRICLKFYKKIISPLIHSFSPNSGCRFYPSCSEYGYQAIEKHGLIKGGIKTLKRILKCHPFGGSGYDPC